jgi:2,5-diketo-D-gluconate reductase A
MTVMEQTFPLSADKEIPAVGFGTYLISNDDVAEAVRTAILLGYRHIDTAAGYRNEEGVGDGIRAGMEAARLSRDDVFVTTKLWPGNPAWGDPPKTRDQTIAEADASLNRLGLDHVDLYLIHAPYGGTERVRQWEALLELKRTGRAHSIGVSNFSQSHLEEIRAAGLPMPDANQLELHPWSQKPELLAYMREHDISPIAYSSLVPLSSWRTEPGQNSAKTEDMRADGVVFSKMAEKYGVSEAQFLLRWGVQSGYPVLPKSIDPERMRQNIDLGGFSIDQSDMDLIKTMDRGNGVAWATGDPSLAD